MTMPTLAARPAWKVQTAHVNRHIAHWDCTEFRHAVSRSVCSDCFPPRVHLGTQVYKPVATGVEGNSGTRSAPVCPCRREYTVGATRRLRRNARKYNSTHARGNARRNALAPLRVRPPSGREFHVKTGEKSSKTNGIRLASTRVLLANAGARIRLLQPLSPKCCCDFRAKHPERSPLVGSPSVKCSI